MASRVLLCSFALLFTLVAAIAAGEASESREYVLTLDHSNFSDTVSKHDFIVAEFYASWCGHCQKLAPEYEEAASILSDHDPPIVLAKVNADDESNKELANEFGVKSYPTIKILKIGGKYVQEYKGPRDAGGIVAYLKKQRGPPSVEIKTAVDTDNLIDDKKVFVAGVFPEFSGEEFENYTNLAERLRSDYDFVHTMDAKLLPRGESSASGPLVRLFKPFDELLVDFQDFNVDALEKFIEASSLPLVTIFNNDKANHPYVNKFFKSPNPKAMLFLNLSNEAADSFTSKYREVAEQYKGQDISFLIGDLEASERAFPYFGVTKEQVPLILVETVDGEKYLKPNLEPDHIAPWVKEYKEGRVQPYRKSEPVPETNNEPVKVVVADSFEDMVFNSKKDVLLEFYAPWCGHCKKLAPILDEVAISYQNDPDLIVAKFDATANDVPVGSPFKVEGFPTLYFRSASGKLTQYDGNRTKEDIIDFIEKNREKISQQDLPKDEL